MKKKGIWKALLLGILFGIIPMSVQASSVEKEQETAQEIETEASTEAESESETGLETDSGTETKESETDKEGTETEESKTGDAEESTAKQKTGTLKSTASSVTIVWPADVKANKGYRIFVRVGNKYVKVGQTSKDENRFKIRKIKGKALKPSTTYTIKVVALSGKGSKLKTRWRRIIRTATVPATPKWVRVKRVSSKKAVLQWKKVKDISGYELQISRYRKKAFETVDLIKPIKVRFAIKNLEKNRTYYVRIRTYKTVTGGRVYSSWSKIKKI